MEQLEFIRNGGETVRYHGWPVIRRQNVAEHSFHVAMLVYVIAGQREPGIRLPLIMAALTHDLAEHKVGDMPGTAKRNMPDYPEGTFREVWGAMEQQILKIQSLDWEGFLTDDERRILKLADAFEGALYTIRERMMGNRLVASVFVNYHDWASKLVNPEIKEETDVLLYINDMWEQADGSE